MMQLEGGRVFPDLLFQVKKQIAYEGHVGIESIKLHK